jgi:hypothetical protein
MFGKIVKKANNAVTLEEWATFLQEMIAKKGDKGVIPNPHPS